MPCDEDYEWGTMFYVQSIMKLRQYCCISCLNLTPVVSDVGALQLKISILSSIKTKWQLF